MKCPIDQTVLEISNRNNIEIDYCPTCRGVWLDRGELDKLIERSEQAQAAPPAHSPARSEQPEYRETRDSRSYDGDSHRPRHKKKRESFIGDLFDF